MIVAIIQARLNSTRLPKKVLLPFGGGTVLGEVFRNVDQSIVDRTVIASPDKELKTYSMDFWHEIGDDNDLISRYYHAACKFHADPIVRITSDCPLILPEVIDLVIKGYFLFGCEYTFNRCDDEPGGFDDGLDVEVVSFALLQKAYVLAEKREDFTWLREHGPVYRVKPDKDYGPCTSINTKEDYINALEILKNR